MREHKVSWGGYNNDRQTENAKVEARLNLRFAESGTKRCHPLGNILFRVLFLKSHENKGDGPTAKRERQKRSKH